MEIMHVEARYREIFELPADLISRLPQKVTIATTIQFFDSLNGIKQQLENIGKQVKLFRGIHAKHDGQILGCSTNEQQPTDAFLYIGTGLFHPKALLIKNQKPVFTYNPLTKQDSLLTEADVQTILNKQKGALIKYKSSTKIGILVSTKPGQNRLKQAERLKKQLKSENKQAYIFISETLDLNELENFPFIECWVNTACHRITEDTSEKTIINIESIYS